MEFSTKEDIEAPIDAVFRMVSDFGALERNAMRRGAEVRRADDLTAPGEGMRWIAEFRYRGRMREIAIELTDHDPPNRLACDADASGVDARMIVDLVALSPRRTRMAVDLSLKPRTLSARLLVQSLKLARNKLDRRYHLRVAEYAKDLEDRFNRVG